MENADWEVDVLLVEDNPYDAELTINALKHGNKHMRLHHMNDGAEALEFILNDKVAEGIANKNGLRLVILDIKLPRMDGLEVLKKIRADEKTKNLPVVILSSSKERMDVREAYKLGVNSYVVKPVGFDNFEKTISTLAFYWSVINERPI